MMPYLIKLMNKPRSGSLRRPTVKQIIPLEHEEQVNFINWADHYLNNSELVLFAIPNGGKRHKKTAAEMKAEGVRKGIPDLMLAYPQGGYHGLFIEMKRVKGGSVSPEQKDIIARLQKQNYKVVVCKGWDAARTTLMNYVEKGI